VRAFLNAKSTQPDINLLMYGLDFDPMSKANAHNFVTIVNRARVNSAVDKVWEKIGDFGKLHLFLDVSCELILGAGAIGSVRIINDTIVEPMVGAGQYSYTYAQTVGPMSGHSYHGCVACEAVDPTSTEIVYTLVYNQSGIAEDKRISEQARLQDRFAVAVAAMARIAISESPHE
jgi:hypothetical protein